MQMKFEFLKSSLVSLIAVCLFCLVARVSAAQVESDELQPTPSEVVRRGSSLEGNEERADTSDRTSIRRRAPGKNAATSIRGIEFVQPRQTAQSAVRRIPRIPSVRSTVSWVTPRAVRRTLYFDDNSLERYGETNFPHLQPTISVLRFGADATLFPARCLLHRSRGLH